MHQDRRSAPRQWFEDTQIGIETVAKSAPDGYTLLSSIGSIVVTAPFLYKLRFDVERDLVPVAPRARTLMFLVVRPRSSTGSCVMTVSALGPSSARPTSTLIKRGSRADAR